MREGGWGQEVDDVVGDIRAFTELRCSLLSMIPEPLISLDGSMKDG